MRNAEYGVVRLLCGTQGSNRAARIDEMLRDHWGRATLLVPTRQYAARRAVEIVLAGGLAGAWGRPVATFDDFAVDLLRASGRQPCLIRDFERRFLMERAVALVHERGALDDLGSAVETNGFVTHLLRTITQLKQAAIDPPEFRRRVDRRRGHGSLDAAVAEVYAAYQDALLGAGLYDVAGLFWEADLMCREGRPEALQGVEALLLDGFDDFTPSEFRLLGSLAEHVDLMVFGLNYDMRPNQRDLYALPARTAGRIQQAFAAVVESLEAPPPQRYTEFATSNLFWRDRPRLPDVLETDLELLPCSDTVQEIETIGRRVKALLLDEAAPPDEIAVVFRRLGDVAGVLRSVFGEFGIPCRVIQAPTLWDSAVCTFVLSVLEATASWQREAVVDVLTSTWFPSPDAHADAVAVLSRLGQVVSGLEEWRTRLGALSTRLASGAGEDVQGLLRRMPDAREAADALAKRLGTLERLGRLAPARGPARVYAEALDRLLDELGIADAVDAFAIPGIREFEARALAALRDVLGQWQVWDASEQATFTRSAFVARFRQTLQETTFTCPQPKGAVACLDAESVRHLRFDYVFFGGVNEGETPSPPPSNAIYSEEDLEHLSEAGIPIEGKRVHGEREALLFHHVLDVPRKKLCITWHALSRRGQDQHPSPYVGHIEELFPESALRAPAPAADAFVPPPGRAACWRDLRNAAFHQTPPLRDALAEQFVAVRRGAEIEAARHDPSPFGIYDGVLADAPCVRRVAAEFDDDHLYSVQQIETYRACPFRFFVERLLGIEVAEVPLAEFDARVRGTILHDVLQAFHERYRGKAVDEVPLDEAVGAIAELVAEVFDEQGWRSRTAPHGVAVVEKDRLQTQLERYVHIERERGETQWKPTHFEVGFGRAAPDRPHAAGDEPLTTSAPFPLDTPLGPVLFSGRIDRVDRAGAEARIIDYKSGSVPALKDIKAGLSLQLTIYALALEGFLDRDTSCAEADFLPVGRKRRKRPDDWRQRETTAREAVAESVEGIRAGRFAPTPAENACAYCRARRICRYEPGRVQRKERQE